MKLEDQVCSLELAKRLKELKVKQESLFYYNSKTMKLQKGFTSHADEKGLCRWSISAFSVAELGEMLPPYISIKVEQGIKYYYLYCVKLDNGSWEYRYQYDSPFSVDCKSFSKTEADTRAKMHIHLIEKGIVKP